MDVGRLVNPFVLAYGTLFVVVQMIEYLPGNRRAVS